MSDPCGSWRVLHWHQGDVVEMRWCDRTEGPCPYPGTDKHRASERRCATEPGTVLRVKWADQCIEDALDGMTRFRDGGVSPNAQDVQIAVDALAMCVDPDPVIRGSHA